jgi:hypothetical protein
MPDHEAILDVEDWNRYVNAWRNRSAFRHPDVQEAEGKLAVHDRALRAQVAVLTRDLALTETAGALLEERAIGAERRVAVLTEERDAAVALIREMNACCQVEPYCEIAARKLLGGADGC